jgi:hypothetical protein
MKAYNIADLERELSTEGWTITADPWVTPQALPGQVHIGGYTVTLTAPTHETFTGDGPTRTDALREAASNAGLIKPEQPHLQ